MALQVSTGGSKAVESYLKEVSRNSICKLSLKWYRSAEKCLTAATCGSLAFKNLKGALSLLKNAKNPNYCFDKEEYHYYYLQNKKIFGFISFNTCKEDLYINHLCVNPSSINEGIKGMGRSLVEKIVDFAKNHGLTSISLASLISSEGFYKKVGFTVKKSGDCELAITPFTEITIPILKNNQSHRPFEPFILTPPESEILVNQLRENGRDSFAETLEQLADDEIGAFEDNILLAMYNVEGKFEFAYLLDLKSQGLAKIQKRFFLTKKIKKIAKDALNKLVSYAKLTIITEDKNLTKVKGKKKEK